MTKFKIFSGVSFMDKLLFTKHLSIMMKSGVPITEALLVLKDQPKGKGFKRVVEDILKNVESGKTLHDSMRKHTDVFDELYLNMIKTGEESGALETILFDLSSHLGKQHVLRQKIKNAMMYPTIILTATTALALGIGLFILPKILGFFEDLDVELPLQTRILLATINFLKDYGIIVFPGTLILIIVLYFVLHSKPIIASWDRFFLHLPIIGSFSRNINLSYFCHNLGVMLKNGLPISEGIAISSESLGNKAYGSFLKETEKHILKGKALSEKLLEDQLLFPSIVAKMIEVGEKSGTLEENLVYLGDFFESEADETSKNLSTILEPILLLVIGLAVGFIALSIISPIYQLTGGIQK